VRERRAPAAHGQPCHGFKSGNLLRPCFDKPRVLARLLVLLKFPGNAAMDRQGLSSGWVPPARRTRYRYANLLSGPAIDSNRNMRCCSAGPLNESLHTVIANIEFLVAGINACYPRRAIYNPECPEPRRARRAYRRGLYIARTLRCPP